MSDGGPLLHGFFGAKCRTLPEDFSLLALGKRRCSADSNQNTRFVPNYIRHPPFPYSKASSFDNGTLPGRLICHLLFYTYHFLKNRKLVRPIELSHAQRASLGHSWSTAGHQLRPLAPSTLSFCRGLAMRKLFTFTVEGFPEVMISPVKFFVFEKIGKFILRWSVLRLLVGIVLCMVWVAEVFLCRRRRYLCYLFIL